MPWRGSLPDTLFSDGGISVDNWFQWLDNSVGALAKKVLSALGIGWVSFEGITELASQVKASIISAWGQIPADVMNVIALSGFGTAVSIILAALMYKAAMSAFSWLGRLVT